MPKSTLILYKDLDTNTVTTFSTKLIINPYN